MTLAQAYFLLAGILAVPGVLLLTDGGRAALKAFPRSKAAAFVLFGAATAWFLYGLSQMGEADLAGMPRPALLGAFGAAGVAAFWVLPDLLAVRGLAGLLLLTARPVLDAGFGKLPASLALATVTYALIFAALFFGTAPYLLRDWIGAATKTPGRACGAGTTLLVVAGVCLGFGFAH